MNSPNRVLLSDLPYRVTIYASQRGADALREVGHVILWRWRRLVFLLRWFRGARQADVREWRNACSGTTSNAGGSGCAIREFTLRARTKEACSSA